jgi:hypothetical protein
MFEIAGRMRHHAEDVGIAVLAEDLAGAFAGCGGIAVVDAGHGFSLEIAVAPS